MDLVPQDALHSAVRTILKACAVSRDTDTAAEFITQLLKYTDMDGCQMDATAQTSVVGPPATATSSSSSTAAPASGFFNR